MVIILYYEMIAYNVFKANHSIFVINMGQTLLFTNYCVIKFVLYVLEVEKSHVIREPDYLLPLYAFDHYHSHSVKSSLFGIFMTASFKF